MPYLVEAAWFKAEGALVDWAVVAGRLKMPWSGASPRSLHQRWMVHRDLGMPTEPFIVWRRPKVTSGPGLKVLNFSAQPAEYLFGDTLVTWPEGSMCRIILETNSQTGCVVTAFAGSPTYGSSMQMVSVGTGVVTTVIEATEIDGLIIQNSLKITKISGIPQDWVADDPNWQKFEVVGLPVVPAEWGSIGKWGLSQQGMITALTDPGTAATQRLSRGAPQIGWQLTLPTGESVPAWQPSNHNLLLTEMRTDVVSRMRPVLQQVAPNQQAAWTEEISLPPVTNPNTGESIPIAESGPQKARHSPVANALIGGSTDPWLALVLGFGTAYPMFGAAGASPTMAAVPGADSFDYMVTARWDKGLDGKSAPLDMAALVPTPGLAPAVPVPANPVSGLMGYVRPQAADLPWRCSVRTAWDRPTDEPVGRPRTYSFASVSKTPAEPAMLVMQRRANNSGFRYPLINSAQMTPLPDDWWQISAVARNVTIPINTGNRKLRYGLAHQDIYGQWSPWITSDCDANQPGVDDVSIVSATLKPISPADPSLPNCNASLTIEFIWDWRVRRPKSIEFRGRLYAAAKHGDPPPALNVPTGFPRTLGGAQGPVVITFNGDTPGSTTDPGATFVPLSSAGDKTLASYGAAQGMESRRYRVTIPGFVLNYANTGHIGLGIWARGQERVLPLQRWGDWSEKPMIITASDPRPPIMSPDIVELASLPDAAGQCHAALIWGKNQPATNATGYFIYESTETKFRDAAGLPSEAHPEMTLSERLTIVKHIFTGQQANAQGQPVQTRQLFTRRNEKPIKEKRADVTLPKGSTSIHLFVVIGVNAGQVEAAWPVGGGSDAALYAVAAPRVMKPAPPLIEVRPVLDTNVNPPVYRAQVLVSARPGPRVKRVELFRVRVDDAAKQLETMGPAVAVIDGTGNGWTVESFDDAYGTNIGGIDGRDTPTGSWKRVWYRAAAWSAPDTLRGYLKGRSPESSAVWCVVPPSTPPNLSQVAMLWPGGDLSEVLLRWTSTAPVARTPVGAHVLGIRVEKLGDKPLIQLTQNLEHVGKTPPGAGQSGVWITGGSGASTDYSAMIRRGSVNDALQVGIRITDPMGRTSERVLSIGAGPVLPMPDLFNLTVVPSVTPAGTFLNFQTHAPLDVTYPTPYVIDVTANRTFPPASTAVQHMPLPIVPLDEPGDVPGGLDPLRIRRTSDAGHAHSFYAFCRVPLKSFVVRITAPDGRSVEETVVVN
ncbi:MAG TPA: hypothetical protein VES20_21195 [Bryobacteraceae bacterium]|nr:hypothetical protein [Bryobacteraceae bacterium]